MATFKPITSEEIASSSCRVKVLGEPAEVWASWWNDCDSADTSKKYLFGVVEDDEKPFVRWVTVWPAVNCARQRVNGTQMHLIKPECADSELKHRYMKIIAVQSEILNCKHERPLPLDYHLFRFTDSSFIRGRC